MVNPTPRPSQTSAASRIRSWGREERRRMSSQKGLSESRPSSSRAGGSSRSSTISASGWRLRMRALISWATSSPPTIKAGLAASCRDIQASSHSTRAWLALTRIAAMGKTRRRVMREYSNRE